MNKSQVASLIDHTCLAPQAGIRGIVVLCTEAKKYGFHSVCINPVYVNVARDMLMGSQVKVCTVVGFPFGAVLPEDKAAEARHAIEDGADEIDMVMNIGAAVDGRYTHVEQDILSVVQTSWEAGNKMGKEVVVKVILETCYLDDNTIVTCCECARKAGAHFVKTSTGYGTPKGPDGKSLPNGATAHHVSLMASSVGNAMKVKASGGIRTPADVVKMLEAGASRIGASASVAIMDAWDESVHVKNWD